MTPFFTKAYLRRLNQKQTTIDFCDDDVTVTLIA